MKANFNKDAILRHKFWIMLGIAVPLIIGGQFMLLVPVAGEIQKDKDIVMAAVKAGNNVKAPFYNADNIDEKFKQVKKSQLQENSVWATVWAREQSDLFWPEAFDKVFKFHTNKFLRGLVYVDAGATPPVPDDEHHLTGKLAERDNLKIIVQTKDNKKVEFYRVNIDEMKLPAGFFELSLGKDVQVTYQTGRYFNDKLNDVETGLYATTYASQIRPILDIVEPLNEDGEGVVQLKNWPVPVLKKNELPPKDVRFLRFVTPPWDTNKDISEEAWLAQEDLWVQKEFYRLIRMANDYVGKMQRFEGATAVDFEKDKGVMGLNKAAVYKNPYFELTLKLLASNKLEVTIKNLQNHRQKLEVKFRCKFTDDKSVLEDEKINVDGEPLDPKGTKDAKDNPKDVLTKVIDLPPEIKRNGIYHCSQVLTWETAAVRRIDTITIGSMSSDDIAQNHRTYPDGVKPLVPEPKKPDAPDGTDPTKVSPNPFTQIFPGGGGGRSGDVLTERNFLIKNRYSEEPTEQTRRLPVALALIVDQDHIDRVLTAFGNSKFRFVMHQMLVNRYPHPVRPAIAAAPQDKFQPIGPVGPKGFGPVFPREGFGPGFGPGPGPFGPAMSPLNMTGDEELESNVELVVYGTVTLYNRYPPRNLPKEGDAAPKQ